MQRKYKTIDEAKAATERFRDEYVTLIVTAEGAESHDGKMIISCNGCLRDIDVFVGALNTLARRVREDAKEKEIYNFPEVIGE